MQKLVIPKGSFSSVTQGNWIFVVENGIATKRKIELGRENPVYYEVRTGLKEGEEIIVSNYEDYKHVEKLELK